MESFHGLLLRLVHFERSHWHLVLVALAARLHLVADVDVRATPGEPLLQEDLVVAHLQLVRREAHFVVLLVSLLPFVGLPLAFAVGALGTALLVTVRPCQQN